MRRLGLGVSLLALVAAGADFWFGTRSLLRERTSLQAELTDEVATALAQVRALGAPPASDELEQAIAARRAANSQTDALAERWWNGARRASDYLVPRSSRPQSTKVDLRPRLEEALLEFATARREVPGLTAARLGLVTPSLTRGLELDGAEFADQVERVVIARFLAAVLAPETAIELSSVLMTRGTSGRIAVQLQLVGALDSLVTALEALVRDHVEAPPRRAETLSLQRVAPDEWSLAGPLFASPPARLEVTLTFQFPTPPAEPQR